MPEKEASDGKPRAGSPASRSSKLLIWIAVAAVAVALGFLVMRPADGTELPSGEKGVPVVVDAGELSRLASEGVLVVDVRSPGEFGQGHVPGAVNVPYTDIPAVAPRWNPAEPIAVYCLSGDRSSTAVDTLVRMGFQEIYHFDVGLQAWTGPLDQGLSAATPETEDGVAVAGPVMYEFYSDG